MRWIDGERVSKTDVGEGHGAGLVWAGAIGAAAPRPQRKIAFMMIETLVPTALLMGLAGGPHCIAMCGAACAGISGAAGRERETSGMWWFQLGRLLGYSALGALAAASMQGLGWLTVQSAAIRPVWTLFHVAMALLGMVLLVRARQPIWLESAARAVWQGVRTHTARIGRGAPVAVGALWALMPCGLLYSALLVAALTGEVVEGALVMALFSLGSGASLILTPWLVRRLRGGTSGANSIRLAGLALAVTSGWTIWMGLAHNGAPWCVAP